MPLNSNKLTGIADSSSLISKPVRDNFSLVEGTVGQLITERVGAGIVSGFAATATGLDMIVKIAAGVAYSRSGFRYSQSDQTSITISAPSTSLHTSEACTVNAQNKVVLQFGPIVTTAGLKATGAGPHISTSAGTVSAIDADLREVTLTGVTPGQNITVTYYSEKLRRDWIVMDATGSIVRRIGDQATVAMIANPPSSFDKNTETPICAVTVSAKSTAVIAQGDILDLRDTENRGYVLSYDENGNYSGVKLLGTVAIPGVLSIPNDGSFSYGPLTVHLGATKQVDNTSTDATKDKHLSNALAKSWTDHAAASAPHSGHALTGHNHDLDALQNITITSKVDKNILYWDAASGKWKNGSPSLAGAVTAITSGDTFTSITNTSGSVSVRVNTGTTSSTVSLGNHNHDTVYAPIGEGVTGGDAHDHSGGDGGTISYTNLSNKPTIPTDISAKKYIVQTADASLTGAQALGALSTGILKNTTTTGVLSIAVAGTDFVSPATTVNGKALSSSITLSATDIAEVAGKRYMTDAQDTTLTNLSSSYLISTNLTVQGIFNVTGTTATAGYFYAGTTAPSGTTRTNYNGYLYTTRTYGAVFNDYAEMRLCAEEIAPGYVCVEVGDGTVKKAKKRLAKTAMVVSDTYGMCMGEQEGMRVPVAVAGRVLVHTEKFFTEYKVGDVVCAGKNGKVSKMNWLERILFPDRILGIVSEIPYYLVWGTGNIKVNDRIWITI